MTHHGLLWRSWITGGAQLEARSSLSFVITRKSVLQVVRFVLKGLG